MIWRFIGEFFLNISTAIYLFWFVPQLVLTFRQRSIAAISLNMHVCLCLGYISDFAYGFGMNLPLQYKLVTILGLMMMAVEHVQFCFYSTWNLKQQIGFYLLTFFLVALFIGAVYSCIIKQYSAAVYNAIGTFSLLCWMLYAWPQVFKNFVNRSVAGISGPSVVLSLLTGIGDLIAAYALAWPWPSKIGSLLGLIPKLLLFWQCYYYRLCREVLNEA